MTDTPTPPGDDFDPEARKQAHLERLQRLDDAEARRQIAVLPYYHLIENEITKPNRGIFVTTYFLMRWAPALGTPAVNIVLALRKLANKDGQTFASLDTIAQVAGVGRTTLTLWLSTNEERWKVRRPEERRQWELLHEHFLRSKSNRYLIRQEGGLSRAKRTTNLYQVAMDDPVHPDDTPKLYVLAAERMVQEEAEQRRKALENNDNSYTVAPRPNRTGKVVVREDRPTSTDDGRPYTVAPRPYEAGRTATGLSLSDRLTSPNVSATGKKPDRTEPSLFSQDPRVCTLGADERRKLDALVDELGDYLRRKDGWRDDGVHQSAGAHKRAVYFLGEHVVRQAMRTLDDRIQEGRAGRKEPVRNASAAFWGIVKRLAEQEGLSLAVEGEDPAEAQNEAVASPHRPPKPTTASRRALLAEEADGTPEARARIYADHLFPFRYRLDHDRDPSDEEKQAAYEARLAELQAQRS